MAKVLLTGGAGYIGSHTYVALIAAGHDVVIIDNFSNAKRDVPDRLARLADGPVQVIECDVRDPVGLATVFAAHAFDAVVHFAAKKAVGESVSDPIGYFQSNIGGLMNVLQAMQAAGVFTLVFSSSATVYGEPDIAPTPEDAPYQHRNPYGYTKIAGEQILAQVAASDPRWRFGILRYFNPAGAHPSALIGEDPDDIPNNLMPYIASVATGDLPRLRVFGSDYDTPDGTGVRDYIHVQDLARGHVLSLAALLATGQGHTVNLGTGRGYSVLEMLRAYSAACGRDLPYDIVDRRPGDVPVYLADPARAEQLLGFTAEHGLDDMCQSSWAWVSGQLRNDRD